MKEEEKQKQQQEYNEYVKQVTPTRNLAWAMCRAFIVGGLICIIGQLILNTAVRMGLDKEMAGSWCSLCLIFLSIVLTGFNIYPSFANSVAAPAIEFQKEGQVFGIGAKIFTIAGPVILYGIFSSWVLGLGYWIGKVSGIF